MKYRHGLLLLLFLAPGLARAQWWCLEAFISVLEPASIACSYNAGRPVGDGSWADTTGLISPGVTGELLHVEDPGVDSLGAKPGEGCAPLTNGDEIAGNFALIRRGACEFGLKALHAQEAGARGWIVYNDERVPDDDTTTVDMLGGQYGLQVFIPGVFASRVLGLLLLDALERGERVRVNMRYDWCENWGCYSTTIEPQPDGSPGTHALSDVSPNPSAGRASFTLEVAATQRVRVAVYDALGREVAALHDGLLPAGAAHTLTFDGRGLAAGLYVVRIEGEAFSNARTLALVR
jgi:hypothetical protein